MLGESQNEHLPAWCIVCKHLEEAQAYKKAMVKNTAHKL